MRIICAWHKGFNPTDPANRGASHGCCKTCEARLHAEMDAQDAARAAIANRQALYHVPWTRATQAILAGSRS